MGLRSKVSLAVLSLGVFSGTLPAAPGWSNGQGARLIIGQPSPTRQDPVPSQTVLGAAGGVAIVADRLFVADGNRVGAVSISNRALIYDNLSGFLPEPDEELPQGEPCPVCVGVADVVLGQQDFDSIGPGLQDGFQNASAIASDGVYLAVADSNNNRVLIWNSIPTLNATPPDVVVGQPDSMTNAPGTSQETMRGPQGVWIDGGRLFVADTGNSRVLIYNSIPSSNGAGADAVLGQPDFDTRPEPDLTQSNIEPTASAMLNPASVTVSSGRMLVTDLGFNRVLIFNTVPTQNAAPADVVVGQPDLESNLSNNSAELCDPLPAEPPEEGEEEPEPTFPRRCAATLSFPRFALSDGEQLFVADGGNDRVLIFNDMPTTNGVRADTVLGEPDFESLVESDGASDLRAPSSLAYDGENLYVTDPFTRRILVFTQAEDLIMEDGLRNGASFSVHTTGEVIFRRLGGVDQEITITIGDQEYVFTTEEGESPETVRDDFVAQINTDPETVIVAQPFGGEGLTARASIVFGGDPQAGDVVTLRIVDQEYEIVLDADDTLARIVDIFLFLIERARDPNVLAFAIVGAESTLTLRSVAMGPAGNEVDFSVTFSSGSALTVEPTDGNLSGGTLQYGMRLVALEDGADMNGLSLNTVGDRANGMAIERSSSVFTGGANAGDLPPGTLATIFGSNLADAEFGAALDASGKLPTELGGVQVYTNGILSPLFFVGPDQINFQVPWEVEGTSISVYVRRRLASDRIMVSVPRATRAPTSAPGLFSFPGFGIREGIVVHGTEFATGSVALSQGGTGAEAPVDAGVTVTITVQDRDYTYVTVGGDTQSSVRDRLVELINVGDGDPDVVATAGRESFFSARANVTFTGEVQSGDTVSILIGNTVEVVVDEVVQEVVDGIVYTVVAQEDDTLEAVRNKMVVEINAGRGNPLATARNLEVFGEVILQVVARELGTEGNDIVFDAMTSSDAVIMVETNVEEGTLEGGLTPPVVRLTARESGTAGNDILFGGSSTNDQEIDAVTTTPNLCCGNELFSLVSEANPAIPGETIVVFATGLGLTSPVPSSEGLESGEITPNAPLFETPLLSADTVSSLAAEKTASVEFVGLMPGFVGVFQINLRLNSDLPDLSTAALTIAQRAFISNIITFPIKNLRPIRPQ